MTDDTAPIATSNPSGYSYSDPPDLDGMLQVFAMTEELDSGMSITVTTAGAIITGDIIGRDGWMTKQAAAIDPAGETNLDESFSRFSLAGITAGHADFQEYYLHLQNARYLTGGNLVPNSGDGCLIRVRLSEIGAWSFGRLAAVENS